jgi:hypothetical protein
MITQFQVHLFLKMGLPGCTGVKVPLNNLKRTVLSARSAIKRFVDFTSAAVQERDSSKANQCFTLAESLYKEGDAVVKMLIESVYVHSLLLFMPSELSEKKQIETWLPINLYDIYLKQLTSSVI